MARSRWSSTAWRTSDRNSLSLSSRISISSKQSTISATAPITWECVKYWFYETLIHLITHSNYNLLYNDITYITIDNVDKRVIVFIKPDANQQASKREYIQIIYTTTMAFTLIKTNYSVVLIRVHLTGLYPLIQCSRK